MVYFSGTCVRRYTSKFKYLPLISDCPVDILKLCRCLSSKVVLIEDMLVSRDEWDYQSDENDEEPLKDLIDE